MCVFLSCFCLYICLFLPDELSFSFPFFLSTFVHVFLSWLLSFHFPCPCLFFNNFCLFSFSLFLSLVCLFSLHYLSLSSGERSLTRSPWSSRAQWRESWVWWTTCLALSATSTRCPPSPASTAPTRRSIITRMMTHLLHFIRPIGLISLQHVGPHK